MQTLNIKLQKLSNQPSLLKRNELLRPFLKWAGGKRQLLPELRKYYPNKYGRYYEPFLGAAAVLFDLQPKKATISDFNAELINVYNVIKNNADELIEKLRHHKENNTEEYYYKLRVIDREDQFKELSSIEKAARIIYLNKTCFNGLFRVNSQGQFNVPYGNYENPLIVDEIVIKAVNHYLNKPDIKIFNLDFVEAVVDAKKSDFIYFDPPYHPISDTSSFTGYNLQSFGEDDQIRLRDCCDDLIDRGCDILLSNSDSQFIRDLYSDDSRYDIYDIKTVQARRAINAVSTGRGKINEVLIFNNYGNKSHKK
jgi:DNA adenine methylase